MKRFECCWDYSRYIYEWNFRVYTNEDIKGVEIAAAFKNIYALACRISNGLGFGDNLKALLLREAWLKLCDLELLWTVNKILFMV